MIDNAQAKARLDAMIERKIRQYGDGSPEVESTRRVAKGLSDILAGKPPQSVRETADRFEQADRKAVSLVSRWFASAAGSTVRWLAFLEGADDRLHNMMRTAIGDEQGFDAGAHVGPGDLIAIRKGEAWKLTDQATLEVIIEHVSDQVVCDLDFFAGSAFGSCMNNHAKLLKSIAKCDGVGRDGKPNKLRRDYLAERFSTVPFALGCSVVLVRACNGCLAAFAASNQIAAHTMGIVDVTPSGFGSVGVGTVQRSEICWGKETLAEVADEFEARNSRRPTVMELQKALQGAKFVGEGAPKDQP